MITEKRSFRREERIVVVSGRVKELGHGIELVRLNIENLNVAMALTGSSSGNSNHCFGAVCGSCRSKAVYPRRSDSNRISALQSGAILWQINSKNTPPTIISLAVKINGRITRPSWPATVSAHHRPLAGIGFSENNNISAQIMEFTGPTTVFVGCNCNQVSRLRNRRTVINTAVRSQADSGLFMAEGGGIKSGPAGENLLGRQVSGDIVEALISKKGTVEKWTIRAPIRKLFNLS